MNDFLFSEPKILTKYMLLALFLEGSYGYSLLDNEKKKLVLNYVSKKLVFECRNRISH